DTVGAINTIRRTGRRGVREDSASAAVAEALTAEGPPETAPTCAAVILKAKPPEGERIRTSRIHAGESQIGQATEWLQWSASSLVAAPCCQTGDCPDSYPPGCGHAASGLRSDLRSRE